MADLVYFRNSLEYFVKSEYHNNFLIDSHNEEKMDILVESIHSFLLDGNSLMKNYSKLIFDAPFNDENFPKTIKSMANSFVRIINNLLMKSSCLLVILIFPINNTKDPTKEEDYLNKFQLEKDIYILDHNHCFSKLQYESLFDQRILLSKVVEVIISYFFTNLNKFILNDRQQVIIHGQNGSSVPLVISNIQTNNIIKYPGENKEPSINIFSWLGNKTHSFSYYLNSIFGNQTYPTNAFIVSDDLDIFITCISCILFLKNDQRNSNIFFQSFEIDNTLYLVNQFIKELIIDIEEEEIKEQHIINFIIIYYIQQEYILSSIDWIKTYSSYRKFLLKFNSSLSLGTYDKSNGIVDINQNTLLVILSLIASKMKILNEDFYTKDINDIFKNIITKITDAYKSNENRNSHIKNFQENLMKKLIKRVVSNPDQASLDPIEYLDNNAQIYKMIRDRGYSTDDIYKKQLIEFLDSIKFSDMQELFKKNNNTYSFDFEKFNKKTKSFQKNFFDIFILDYESNIFNTKPGNYNSCNNVAIMMDLISTDKMKQYIRSYSHEEILNIFKLFKINLTTELAFKSLLYRIKWNVNSLMVGYTSDWQLQYQHLYKTSNYMGNGYGLFGKIRLNIENKEEDNDYSSTTKIYNPINIPNMYNHYGLIENLKTFVLRLIPIDINITKKSRNEPLVVNITKEKDVVQIGSSNVMLEYFIHNTTGSIPSKNIINVMMGNFFFTKVFPSSVKDYFIENDIMDFIETLWYGINQKNWPNGWSASCVVRWNNTILLISRIPDIEKYIILHIISIMFFYGFPDKKNELQKKIDDYQEIRKTSIPKNDPIIKQLDAWILTFNVIDYTKNIKLVSLNSRIQIMHIVAGLLMEEYYKIKKYNLHVPFLFNFDYDSGQEKFIYRLKKLEAFRNNELEYFKNQMKDNKLYDTRKTKPELIYYPSMIDGCMYIALEFKKEKDESMKKFRASCAVWWYYNSIYFESLRNFWPEDHIDLFILELRNLHNTNTNEDILTVFLSYTFGCLNFFFLENKRLFNFSHHEIKRLKVGSVYDDNDADEISVLQYELQNYCSFVWNDSMLDASSELLNPLLFLPETIEHKVCYVLPWNYYMDKYDIGDPQELHLFASIYVPELSFCGDNIYIQTTEDINGKQVIFKILFKYKDVKYCFKIAKFLYLLLISNITDQSPFFSHFPINTKNTCYDFIESFITEPLLLGKDFPHSYSKHLFNTYVDKNITNVIEKCSLKPLLGRLFCNRIVRTVNGKNIVFEKYSTPDLRILKNDARPFGVVLDKISEKYMNDTYVSKIFPRPLIYYKSYEEYIVDFFRRLENMFYSWKNKFIGTLNKSGIPTSKGLLSDFQFQFWCYNGDTYTSAINPTTFEYIVGEDNWYNRVKFYRLNLIEITKDDIKLLTEVIKNDLINIDQENEDQKKIVYDDDKLEPFIVKNLSNFKFLRYVTSEELRFRSIVIPYTNIIKTLDSLIYTIKQNNRNRLIEDNKKIYSMQDVDEAFDIALQIVYNCLTKSTSMVGEKTYDKFIYEISLSWLADANRAEDMANAYKKQTKIDQIAKLKADNDADLVAENDPDLIQLDEEELKEIMKGGKALNKKRNLDKVSTKEIEKYVINEIKFNQKIDDLFWLRSEHSVDAKIQQFFYTKDIISIISMEQQKKVFHILVNNTTEILILNWIKIFPLYFGSIELKYKIGDAAVKYFTNTDIKGNDVDITKDLIEPIVSILLKDLDKSIPPISYNINESKDEIEGKYRKAFNAMLKYYSFSTIILDRKDNALILSKDIRKSKKNPNVIFRAKAFSIIQAIMPSLFKEKYPLKNLTNDIKTNDDVAQKLYNACYDYFLTKSSKSSIPLTKNMIENELSKIIANIYNKPVLILNALITIPAINGTQYTSSIINLGTNLIIPKLTSPFRFEDIRCIVFFFSRASIFLHAESIFLEINK